MKIHRISLSSESYARLSYISAIEQISQKDWIEQRIEEAWSLREGSANKPIVQLDDKPAKVITKTIKPKPAQISSGEWGSSGVPRKRKRIADDQPAMDHIRSRLEQGATAAELELEMMGKASSAVRRIAKGIKEEMRKG